MKPIVIQYESFCNKISCYNTDHKSNYHDIISVTIIVGLKRNTQLFGEYSNIHLKGIIVHQYAAHSYALKSLNHFKYQVFVILCCNDIAGSCHKEYFNIR